MHTRHARRLRILALSAAVMLLASACIKVNLAIEVNDDGSATIEGISALNTNALEDFAEAFGEEQDLCAEFANDSGIDTEEFDEVSPYNEGGLCGVQFKDIVSAEEIAASEELPGGDGAILRRDGQGWYFELPLDSADLTGDLGGAGDIPGLGNVFEDAEFEVRVKLPGRQVEHNGDSIDGDGFVVWDVDLLNPPGRLFLRTEPGETITGGGGGGGAGTILAIIFAALIVLGLAAFFISRRKSAGDAAAPPAPGVTPAPAGEWAAPATPPVDSGGWAAPAADVPAAAPAAPAAPSAAAATTADSQAPAPEPVVDDDATVELQPIAAEPAAPAEQRSPTIEEATGQSVWDPVRGKYVQWDPGAARWLVFDQDTQAWSPE